jgi:HD-GYP domain-containing protein (c-di-GMP phosphodiesterase class II)
VNERSSDNLLKIIQEYEALLEIGVELAGTHEIEKVLEVATVKAEELCGAETGSIWELDENRELLFFRIVRGRAAGEIRSLTMPMGRGIVGHVAETGVAEVVNNVSADPRWQGELGASFSTRAILCVPLKAHGQIVGVLQLLNPKAEEGFTKHDLRYMELFAGSLATAIGNARLYANQRRQFLGMVTSLAEAVDKRDPYTGDHIRRVVDYSLLLAQKLEANKDELEQIRLAATLHDIGKIAIPDAILRKPTELSPAESEIIRRHPIDGWEIIAHIHELKDILPAVRGHHERLDGAGYPDGLAGEEIPFITRVVAVADTFDAMTTDRPYRRGLSPDEAADEIYKSSGTQFCPIVVQAFRELFSQGKLLNSQAHAESSQLLA